MFRYFILISKIQCQATRTYTHIHTISRSSIAGLLVAGGAALIPGWTLKADGLGVRGASGGLGFGEELAMAPAAQSQHVFTQNNCIFLLFI